MYCMHIAHCPKNKLHRRIQTHRLVYAPHTIDISIQYAQKQVYTVATAPAVTGMVTILRLYFWDSV